ncbi:MAG: class I SAM-dependent methyltransferase [Thiohalocapsa sp.]
MDLDQIGFEDSGTSSPSVDLSANGDLKGEAYRTVLGWLHQRLAPKTYFEIGTAQGNSLALASCATIAIDPAFRLQSADVAGSVIKKNICCFFQMTSDEFFRKYDPISILGEPIALAFLDGMHRCENLLRDFINTERFCRKNSVIVLHDCLPVEASIATRVQEDASPTAHRQGWWTGDVWRTALLLKKSRPDLKMLVLDAPPTGLVCISNLDPTSRILEQDYFRFVETMLNFSLDNIGIHGLFREFGVQPTSVISTPEGLSRHFWL